MQNPIGNKKIWVWLVILLIALMFSRYILVQGQPKEYPMYASDSPSPTGVKAFYTYVLNHKDVVKRWSNRQTNYQTTQKINYSLWSNHISHRTVKNWTATPTLWKREIQFFYLKKIRKGCLG